jgi:hypothetical protein
MPTIIPAGPPRLDHDELVAAQAETLGSSRRRYGLAARALFALMDLVYGTTRTLSKFKVLEQQVFVPVTARDYGAFASQADLFRQIAHDERVHKEEGLAAMAQPRFR